MIIKKYFKCIIYITMILVVCSCTKEQQITNFVVEEKMNLLGIENCQIIKLGELPERKYVEEEIKVSESEVEESIQLELESYEKLKPVNHKIVKKGDFVTLAYTVYCEDKIVNEVKGEELKVGAGFFNKEIEKDLIGARKNKTYMINVQVPKDDENKEFAGKMENIKYQVKEIYYMFRPKLTDKFIQKNYGLKNVQEFYEYKKQHIIEEKEKELINQGREDIIEELIEKSTFNMDRNHTIDYAEVIYNEYKDMAIGYGCSIEEFIKDFFGENLEEFYERCCNEAEKEIKRFLVIGAIANKINIAVSDEDVERKFKDINIDDLSKNDFVMYKYQVLEEKVLNYLIDEE